MRYRPTEATGHVAPGWAWRPLARLCTSTLIIALLLGGCANEEPDAPACTDSATLCTWAGTGEAGFDGDGHSLLDSMLYWPIDLTFTSKGEVYLLDWNNHAVRHLRPDGTLQTVIGSGFVGDGPPDLSDHTPPGAKGTDVDLNHPTQLVELSSGKMLLVSWHNHKLRQYDPATGLVVITCGSAPGYGGDGEAARDARVDQPTQVVIAPDGGMFILDMRNQVIRKIGADGIIQTVAGTPGKKGYDGDGGPPGKAHFEFPAGSNPPPGGALALDDKGRLYVSDTLNHAIRRIDFAADRIETFAGTGEAGYGGDGGPANKARLNNPRDLQLSKDGSKLYIADELNHRVRVVDLDSGLIDTAAGNGEAGYDGEGQPPTATALNRPGGLAFDGEGNLYIADSYNHRIRTFKPGAKP